MKPRILIVYTGGTIGMIEDAKTKSLKPFDFTHLMENVPKVKMLDYEIDNIQFNPPIDSSDMNISHWQQIARSIVENYDRYDGFVVLHGTDTMAYTASALSFMLGNLAKPVIITGSQLPIGEVRTDGEENLITALQIAADRNDDGTPTVREVAILFENYLWRGNRSTKRSADNFNAFKSSNYPELAKIGLGITFDRDALAKIEQELPLEANYTFDTHVISIDLFPGLNEDVFRYLLATPGVKGVVLRTYGAGNGPTKKWFIDAIKEAISRGVVILNITQCVNGAVRTNRYMGGDYLAAAGVISGHDMTFEAAITKMMFLFGLGIDKEEVERRLSIPIAGELTI
ncbi:MAG: type I asparaginase [Muribaculaceae bacterium]|nr:type I asparaginase [Muribaculaceae bacterium]